MSRVDFDELEPSEDYLVMLYQGQPFNGIAVEYASNGALIAETEFTEGQKNGFSKEWSSTGMLVREQSFMFDALHGISREWYDNGQLRNDAVYELGICIREQEWDEHGNLRRDYKIDENGPQFSTLQKLRASNLGRLANSPHKSN